MDDMVAELTLRINNQMNVGLDEMRAQMAGIEDDAAGIRTAMIEMNAAMNDVPSGMLLEAGLADLVNEAHAATAAINNIGMAIDEDTAKIKTMFATWGDFATPAGVGQNIDPELAMIPPEARLPDYMPPPDQPPPDQPPPDDPNDGGDSGGKHGGGGHAFGIMDLLALSDAPEALKNNQDFSSDLTQITNTRQLYGDAASTMQSQIADHVTMWAQQYHQSSQTLLDAYKYLITTGMSFQEVDALMPALAEGATAHDIDVGEMQKMVYTLADTLQIPPGEMTAVIGRMGAATKMGHFDAASFGMYLPQMAGALASAGDTGPDVADSTFAAMEAIVKLVGIPQEAATDYTDMIHYIGTQHAMRTFMQMSRMMMPQMRQLFDKYDVAPADLLSMENAAVAEGKDPVQTVLDYVHNVTKNMTPTDRNAVISDYFTNQQGGDAVRDLMLEWNGHVDPKTGQYMPGYQDNIRTLNSMGSGTLDDDFKAAVQNASGDMNLFAENMAELNRKVGAALNFLVIQPANAIISPSALVSPTGNPNLDQAPRNSPMAFHLERPINLHLTVSPDGTVKVPAGQSMPPGVNLRVNQGQVLGAP